MYEPLVSRYAAQYGIPPLLALAMMDRESSGNPRAVSPAGAQGLMQLMPATAAEMGVTDPFDPEQNVRGGLGYLRKQYDRFGTWPLATGAYFSGPERMRLAGDINNLGPQGRAYANALLPYAAPQTPSPALPALLAQEEPAMPNGPLEELMSNPMFLMGAGILANNAGVPAGEAIGRGLLGGTAAWQAQRQADELEEQRKMQTQLVRMKQLEMLRQQAMQQKMVEMLGGGGGAAGGGGMSPAALINAGVVGTLGGLDNMGNLISAGGAMLPYTGMTQAQQAEAQDRNMRRQWEMGPSASGTTGAPGVSGMTPKATQQFAADAPAKVMDYLLAERKSGKVSSAASTLEAVNNARRALDEGMFTGPFAETKAGLAKYLGAYTGELENTQQYIASTAELARQALQQIGGNDSNTDLLFSRATTGGDITMQAKSLDKLMQITDKKARSYLSDYNRFVERLPESERETYKVTAPPGYDPRATTAESGSKSGGSVDYRWEKGRLLPAR